MDVTGSLGGEISNLQSALTTTIIPAIASGYDAAFAVTTFGDYPIAPFGGLGDTPYAIRQSMTTNAALVQTAINGLTAFGGGDARESGTSALFSLASGGGLTWPGGSIAPASVGFRAGAKRIVVVITDVDFHNNHVDADPYTFDAPTFADAVSALTVAGIKTVGIGAVDSSSISPVPNLEAYAAATGARRHAPGGLAAERIDQLLAEEPHCRCTENDDALLVQADDPLVGMKIEQFGQVEIPASWCVVAACVSRHSTSILRSRRPAAA